MKIIDRLTDIELSELFKYTMDDLVIKLGDYNKIYYRIPKELIINEYYSHELSYADKTKGGICYNNQLPSILRWACDISVQEFFDLCILHINDTELRPKCSNPECNNYLPWSGRFCWGYTTGHVNWHEGLKFCCHHCQGVFNRINGITGFGTVANQASAEYGVWMKMGSPDDLCYFYIATTPQYKFKFGITKRYVESIGLVERFKIY